MFVQCNVHPSAYVSGRSVAQFLRRGTFQLSTFIVRTRPLDDAALGALGALPAYNVEASHANRGNRMKALITLSVLALLAVFVVLAWPEKVIKFKCEGTEENAGETMFLELTEYRPWDWRESDGALVIEIPGRTLHRFDRVNAGDLQYRFGDKDSIRGFLTNLGGRIVMNYPLSWGGECTRITL